VTTYTDLEIRIGKKQVPGYPVEITFNGEQEFPPGFLDPAQVEINRAKPQETGNRLFAWLFSDDTLKTAWARARGQQPLRRVRLRIDAEAPELHDIPWELLRDPGEGGVPLDITAAEATPFSRYLAGEWMPGSPILKRPIRMLVAIANPTDLVTQDLAIDGDAEWARLKDVVGSNPNIEMVRLPDPCTLPALEAALRTGFHILHFIGHGAWQQAKREAVLYLADEHNRLKLAKEGDIGAMLARQLADAAVAQEDRLRLVYLSSCQTAVRDPSDVFRGLAPQLVASGVPAVIAMQDVVPVETAQQFSKTFYSQLLDHGEIDRAANAARSSLLTAGIHGAGIPVLFMRLRSGQLFGKRGMILGDVSDAYWRTLVGKIRRGQCTPILGPGVASGLLPGPEELAHVLASGHYPFADTADLRRVSQFLGTFDPGEMRQRVLDQLTTSLRRYLGSSDGTAAINTLSDLRLDQWNQLGQAFETEIHQQLATLRLPLYVTSNFDNFMTLALRARLGGDARVRRETVVWRKPRAERQVLNPPPEADNPVVLHLFGTDQDPESMVLTEDDHLDYLARISHDQEIFLPASVNALLNKNTLLFLGYRLEDLELKVIMRGLLTYLQLDKYDRMQLGVQIESEKPDASTQREVTDYFQQSFRQYFSARSDVKIYWGSAQQFMADLMVHMQELPSG
jgi:hypothetical protein